MTMANDAEQFQEKREQEALDNIQGAIERDSIYPPSTGDMAIAVLALHKRLRVIDARMDARETWWMKHLLRRFKAAGIKTFGVKP